MQPERAIMGRIRTIKPKLFTHEGLYDAEHETGLPLRTAFMGLFTEADREGRFQWRPRTLKTSILPFDELDFSTVLDALEEHHFIMRYIASNGDVLGVIPTFKQHQQINIREAASELEAPCEELLEQWFAHAHDAMHVHDHVQDSAMHVHARGEGKGKEGKGKEGENHQGSKVSSTDSRMRAQEASKTYPPPKLSAVLTRTMREHGIAKASPSNVRIIALADAGVTSERVIEACDEAHATHPDEAIHANYVCSILEAWQHNGHSNSHIATAGKRNSDLPFDERSKRRKGFNEEITGHHRRNGSTGEVIDVDATIVKEIGHDKSRAS